MLNHPIRCLCHTVHASIVKQIISLERSREKSHQKHFQTGQVFLGRNYGDPNLVQ